MSSVDNRVVKMTFDNENFDKNISGSMTLLEKFKESLNFKGIENSFNKITNAASSVSLDGIGQSLDELNDKFSTSNIAWTTMIGNLTNTAVNMAKGAVSKIGSMIKAGGLNRAQNIESAKFQLKGLGIAWTDAEDDINWGVQDTAYGLDSAAKACSQLSASGIKLGDDMKKSLRGISGVAAMTNSSYDEIANIFTTVAGNGRVMAMQLNQIASRGINAAATLAKHFGVTEAELRQMVSDGLVSFDDFATAMDNAFGEHAKEANATFTGALSNVKAALSRIGEGFFTPFIAAEGAGVGMSNNLIDVLNALKPVINEIKVGLAPVYKSLQKVINFLSAKAVDILNGLSDTSNGVSKTAKTVESLFYIFKSGWIILKPILTIAFKLIKALLAPFKMIVDNTDKISKKIGPLALSFGRFFERFNYGTSKLGLFNVLANTLCIIFKGLGYVLYGIVFAISKVLDAIGWVIDGIKKLASKIKSKMKEIKESIWSIIGNDVLYLKDKVVENYCKFTASIVEVFNNLKNKLAPLAEIIDYHLSNIKYIFKERLKQLRSMDFRTFIVKIKDKLIDSFKFVYSSLKQIAKNLLGNFGIVGYVFAYGLKKIASGDIIEGFDAIKDGIKIGYTKIKDQLKETIIKLKENFIEFAEDMGDIFRGVSYIEGGEGFSGVVESVLDTIVNTVRLIFDITSSLTGLDLTKFKEATVTKIQQIRNAMVNSIIDFKGTHPTLYAGLNEFKSMVVDTFQWVADKLPGPCEIIKKSFEKVKNSIKNLFSLGFSGIKEKLKGFVNNFDLLGTVSKVASKIFEGIKSLISKIGPALSYLWDRIKELFNNIKEKFKEYQKNYKPQLEALGNAFKSLWEKIKTLFSNLASNFSLKGTFDIIKGILGTGILGFLLKTAFNITKLTGSLTSMVKGIKGGVTNALQSLSGAFKNLGGYLKSLSHDTNANAVLKLAIAIGILVLATIALSAIDTKALIKAVGVLAVVIFSLSTLFDSIGGWVEKMDKSSKDFQIVSGKFKATFEGIGSGVNSFMKFAGLGTVLIGLGSVIKNIAKAVINLGNIDIASLGKGLGALALIIGSLVGTIYLINKMNLQKDLTLLKGTFPLFIALGLAITMIMRSVKSLAEISSDQFGMLITAFAGISVIIVVLSGCIFALIKAMDKMSDSKYKGLGYIMKTMSSGMLKIAIAVAILSLSIKMLASQNIANIAVAGGILILIIGSLVGALLLTKKIDASKIETFYKAMAIMSAAIAIIALSVNKLASGDMGQNLQAAVILIGAFVVALAALVGAMFLLSKINFISLNVAAGLVGLGVALLGAGIGALAFAKALVIIGESNGKALAGLRDLIKVIPELIKAVGEGLVLLIGVLASALPEITTFLADLILDVILKAIDALVTKIPVIAEKSLLIILKGLDVLIKYAEQLTEKVAILVIKVLNALVKYIPEMVTALWNIFKSLIETVISLAKESNLGVENIILAISGMVIVFALLVICAHYAKDAFKGCVAVLAVCVIMVAVLYVMQELDLSTAKDSVLALGGLAISLSIALIALSLVGKFALEAIQGIGVLAAFIGILTILLVALGELSKITGFEEVIDAGGGILGKIGTALGTFVGNLLAAFGTALSAALVQIGNDLVTFADKMKEFASKMASIDMGCYEATLTIAKCILALAGSEIAAGWANLLTFGQGVKGAGQQLLDFAPFIAEFANKLKDVDPSAIQKAKTAGEIISSLANGLPTSGGLKSVFSGETDLKSFGQQLCGKDGFANAIVEFSNTVSEGNIDLEAVNKACEAGKAIAEMASSLPNEGGLLGKIVGENSMSTVGPQMEDFGKAIAGFSNAVSGNAIDAEAVNKACEAGKAIAEMAKTMPNEGGVAGFFAGENSLSAVGPQIASFGENLKTFSDNVKGMSDSKSIENACDAGVAIANMVSEVKDPGTGGLFASLMKNVTDSSSIQMFFDFITSIGGALDTFSTDVADINKASIDSAVSACTSIVNLMNNDLSTIKGNSDTFAEALKKLGQEGLFDFTYSFENSAEKTTNAIGTMVTNMETAITSNLNRFQLMGMNSMNYMSSGMIDGASFMSDIIDSLENKITSRYETFYSSGKSIMEQINLGMISVPDNITDIIDSMLEITVSYQNAFKNEGKELILSISNGMKTEKHELISTTSTMMYAVKREVNIYNDMLNIGRNLCRGLIFGINDEAPNVKTVARNLAISTYNTMARSLEVRSPSKKTYKLGRYFDMGMANGIKDYSNLIYKETINTGNRTVSIINSAMDNLYSLNDDVFNPVITPVIDLSNAQYGLNTIDGMINRNNMAYTSLYGAGSIQMDKETNMNVNVNMNDSELLTEFKMMKEELIGLRQEVSDMEIILDSGELVGGISNKLDRNLGKNLINARRGI